MEEHSDLIALVTLAIYSEEHLPALEQNLDLAEKNGWGSLVQAIRRIVMGDRDIDLLPALDDEDRTIARGILQAITDPSSVGEGLLQQGSELSRQGRYEQSEAVCRRACILQPNSADVHAHLGLALQGQGRFQEAERAYNKSLELNPQQPMVCLNLGVVLQEQKRFDEALLQFQWTLALKPDSVDAIAHLAYLNERAYRLEEARTLVERGLALSPQNSSLWLIKAKLLQRDNRIEEAATALETALEHNSEPSLLSEIHSRLGYLYDRLGNTEGAYRNFCSGNRLTAQQLAQRQIDKNEYRRRIAYLAGLTAQGVPAALPESPEPDATESPVFLVGFPRSGTTLLNQVLDSHPKILALEEKPAAHNTVQQFMEVTRGRPDPLAQLSIEEIKSLRQTYFSTVSKYVRRDPHTIFVDKFPLNIAYAPVLWRIFPNSRYVLALRHPCDACLSCFMHSFGANSAMANFLTLEDTVTLYAQLMSDWQSFAAKFGIMFQDVKYENLVANLKEEATRIFDFLGVGWDDAVLKHTENARRRGVIDTPSYDQITEPLYRRAVYRWVRYAEQFEPHLNTLKPYIDSFDYPQP